MEIASLRQACLLLFGRFVFYLNRDAAVTRELNQVISACDT